MSMNAFYIARMYYKLCQKALGDRCLLSAAGASTDVGRSLCDDNDEVSYIRPLFGLFLFVTSIPPPNMADMRFGLSHIRRRLVIRRHFPFALCMKKVGIVES